MTIQYAILGLLSWQPLTGYDLKKIIAGSDWLYWSGNNNQVYKSLVQLHQQGLAIPQVQYQESLPAKKVYTITEKGRQELRNWVLENDGLPEFRSTFLIQLAWADMLSGEELDSLLTKYEEEVDAQLRMQQRLAKFPDPAQARTPREKLLWEKIAEHEVSLYRRELEWVQDVRNALGKKENVGDSELGY